MKREELEKHIGKIVEITLFEYKEMQELLSRAAEEIENCYGKETELSVAIRRKLNKL